MKNWRIQRMEKEEYNVLLTLFSVFHSAVCCFFYSDFSISGPLTFSTKIIHFSLSTFICLRCVVLGSFGLTLRTREAKKKNETHKKVEKNETTKILHIMKMAPVWMGPSMGCDHGEMAEQKNCLKITNEWETWKECCQYYAFGVR